MFARSRMSTLLSIKFRGNDGNVQWYECKSSYICSLISPPNFCSQSTAATPKIPTTPAIPAAIAPVCFAAPPLEGFDEVAVEPPAAVAELDPVVDMPVLLLVELIPVIDPVPIAFAFLVTLFSSAAAVAMPAKPV